MPDDRGAFPERLRESEARYRTLADLNPLATLVHRDGVLVYANAAAARLLGVPDPAALLGRSPFDFLDPAYHQLARERIRRVLEEESDAPAVETRWRRADGSMVDVEVAGARTTWDGGPAIQVVLRDVTERRRVEAELRRAKAFLEGITLGTEDLIAAQDPDFRYTFFNEAYQREFARLWGGQELHLGDSMLELMAAWPEEREKARVLWARALAGESFRETVPFGPTQEAQQVYDLRFHPVRDADGTIIGAAHIFRNVTERQHAEENMRRARALAEQASQAKSQFLATMSHELRTPLAGVIGYSDLLESEVLGETNARQKETLARIKASSWHLVSIIDEVLTLSRAEAGREEVHREPVDLAAVVRDVVGIVEPQARSRGLVMNTLGAEEPLQVVTDAGKVRQVLVNLVGNAAKYTDVGEIEVRLDRADPAAARVHVHDTGPGIPGEELERIFEPFTQVDSSYKREKSGTGLGLAIARRLARLLGGDVRVDSTVGKGSTFTLEIPR